MWSYVQYRRLGKEVEDQVRKQTTPTRRNSTSPSSNLESGQTHLDGIDEKGRQRLVSLGDEDPLNPKNWPLLDRSKNIAILSFLIFAQGWAGAAESMANTAASKEFHVSKVAETLSTAMYLFGIGSGSLFAGPVSETVGRNPTYLVSTFCYLFFVLGSALTKNFGGQIVCRYFIGLCSSATLSINGASVRDQFRPVKRAFVFPVIAWANVAAPVIAPIAGGWIVDNPRLGWRWTEWVTLMISGAAFAIAVLFLPETYLPLLLDWKAKHLRRVTGDERYVSEHAESASFTTRLRQVLPLPAKFWATEPVISVLGSYLVLLYVLLFTFLSGFDYIFKETYGFSTGQTGSCFGAIAAGATAFTCLAPGFYSWARSKTEYVKGSPIEPEFRLWPAIVTAPFLPIALFWLGWSDNPRVSYWSCLGACFVFGVVLIAIYVSSYEYIVDSYGDHSAIGLASITMTRYLVAGGMVMAARPMFQGIGVHWTLTLLGCIAAILTPAPLIFWKIGHKLRKNSPYAKSPGEQ
ncbi:MFS general substrate transporter [Coniochaeta hoffmannii]|uniref:MFS general substrate transporter n=1 Tax=Coniochaeta hoffmannii TaxID=91930 RepID=A0AA38VN96_9PEZI|nr:MFS general substrate transporter [Coniochaeta hoffmannii]